MLKVNEGDSLSRLVLDFDGESREVLVEVEPGLAKMLKPHQCWGIKFLWDAVFESSEDVKAGRTPGGAILAHCMGLGKTLQTISLIHTVMSNFQVCLLTRSSSVCFLSDTWQQEGTKGDPNPHGTTKTGGFSTNIQSMFASVCFVVVRGPPRLAWHF